MKLDREEYASRRSLFLAKMASNSIAILPAALSKIRNRDAEYAYRQDSDFYYLSGFHEPESVMVLIPGRAEGAYVLFCRERDLAKEVWNGYRAGPEGACANYGADQAFAIEKIDEILPALMDGRQRLYFTLGQQEPFDHQLMAWMNNLRAKARSGAQAPREIVSCDDLLHEMRLFKSAAEIKLMKRAAEISAQAHIRAMEKCRVGMMEYQLEAEFLHEFARHGARHPAYSTIVGGGANACILHYIENDAPLEDGSLVLIDAGCELDHYASDITRTFPVNGLFSEEQKAIYNLVLEAQLAALAKVGPGHYWNEPQDTVVDVITRGLVRLGILQGEPEELIQHQAYLPFYMHRAGHWLGMDVHDVGQYKIEGQWRALEVGMVLTVEPGIYIAKDNMDVEVKWRGIGVRIEDDVLVTESGHEVLTAQVPKTVNEIEALMLKKVV